MRCLICGNRNFKCIHHGTRDVASIDVMKCTECGMIQLDEQKENTEENYINGGMLKNSYSVIMDKNQDFSWKLWIRETEQDDNRRYNELEKMCIDKSVLEIGCGNGGFLRRIKHVASNVAGVELMDEAREYIKKMVLIYIRP